MKTNITYTPTKYYNKTTIIQWIWFFRRYKFVKGFIMRIFGIYINVRESNATEKIIMKHKAKALTKEEVEQGRSNAYKYLNL